MRAIEHFKTITHHRHLVQQYCFRLGLYYQGLTHDLSKYSPSEFWRGVKYYQGYRSPNDAERRENGVSLAWLHHKGRNRQGVAVQLTLRFIRTARALEVLHAGYELGGRVFRKVVAKPLPEYPRLCAVRNYLVAMSVYGSKVSEKAFQRHFLLLLPLEYAAYISVRDLLLNIGRSLL